MHLGLCPLGTPLNPGCRMVGLSTVEEFVTESDLQSSCYSLVMSTGCVSNDCPLRRLHDSQTF